MPGAYSFAMDVDDNGNIWAGGSLGEYTTKWGVGFGGNLMIPFGNIDANGVPFSGSVPRFVDVPSTVVPAGMQGQGRRPDSLSVRNGHRPAGHRGA
ncbi:MAG: hypothetical protein IPO35_00725 [Uliginosibacterium sp.]|nr:hypothetical protein [Uliginosibacterium sp.]